MPVTLTCSATCSNGTCKFSWLQSNVVEQSSNSTHSIASIASVNRTNAGTYECNVVDGDGETKTARYVLAVYCKCISLL